MSRKMVPFRLDPERMKELRMYCVENDTSIQKLLEDYVDLLLTSKEKGINLLEQVQKMAKKD